MMPNRSILNYRLANILLFMVLPFVVITALAANGESFYSERDLVYRSYRNDTGAVAETASVLLKPLKSGEKRFESTTRAEALKTHEEFVLDSTYMTRIHKRANLDRGTDYIIEKKGHTLFIDGMFEGVAVHKTVDLDDKPFYESPKFNLTQFALSGNQVINFWMFRADRLSIVLMQAKKRGEDMLSVNGIMTPTVRILVSENGMREKYFWRYLYFRKSDGLFIKSVTSSGLTEDLVSAQ